MPSPERRARGTARLLTVVAAALAAVTAIALGVQSTSAAGGVLAPGTFTGMGFDACAAPSATTMDKWMRARENPYRAVGVYISGGLRACSQPNLTASWVSHVSSTGWRILPLTVGPQASCSGFRLRVSDNPTSTYSQARAQGRAEAAAAAATASGLGLVPRSTLFYDMESWHTGYERCDASTLWFLSAWSNELHRRGYTAGVYSSASTGVRLLDRIASAPPSGFVVPDQIWYAEWNDRANTATGYINPANWATHARVHQFYGGHKATNGGVSLNIDSNWVDLVTPGSASTPAPKPTPTPTATPTPKPSPTPTPTPKPTPKPSPTPTPKSTPAPTPTAKPTPTASASPAAVSLRCTRARVTRTAYPRTMAGSSPALVSAAQCLLRQHRLYTGSVTGHWNQATTNAVRRFQHSVGLPEQSAVDNHTWTALLSAGYGTTLRLGSSRPTKSVVALARALNAAANAGLHGTGYFGDLTRAALVRYQQGVFGHANGVADARTWAVLHRGRVPAPKTVSRTTARPAQPARAATASPTAAPQPSHPVAAGATDPALASGPQHSATQRSIGVQAPVRKAAPALPKAQQLKLPRMEPAAAARTGSATAVPLPLFTTALQVRMWNIMSGLNTATEDVMSALIPWLDAGAAPEGS